MNDNTYYISYINIKQIYKGIVMQDYQTVFILLQDWTVKKIKENIGNKIKE